MFERKSLKSRRLFVLSGACCFAGLASVLTARSAEDGAEQKAAIAEIEKLGGRIERDETVKEKDKPIVAITLSTTQAGDDALDRLKAFDHLKKLSLNSTKITNAGLERLKSIPTLEKLYLVDAKIDDAGLDHLKELKHLRVLSLVGTGTTDAGLDKLKSLGELSELYLYGTKVTDEGVKKLKEAAPKLKIDR